MIDTKTEEAVLSILNLDHKSLQDGVTHLKIWLLKQPHLPNLKDEELLKAFIVGSKSVERAKERLERYFTTRTKYPMIFSNRDATNIPKNSLLQMGLLPGVTAEGHYVIMLISPQTKAALDAFSFVESTKYFFMIMDSIFRKIPITSGQIVVFDCQGMSMEYLRKFITTITAAVFDMYQNVFPIRVKSIICFNASSVAEIFCNKILKVLLSEKIGQRVFAHAEDQKVLSKYFPADMLPREYGGKSGSLEELFDDMLNRLKEENDWFLNEGSEGSNENKRPKDSKTPEQLQGTFRKLQID